VNPRMSKCIVQYAHMHSSALDSRPLVDRRDSEHELWLAMRSAYDSYKEASETLDAVASRGPIPISGRDGIRGIESLAAKQRIEFEKYIEKRIEYSEFVRDRSNSGAMHISIQRTADSTAPNQRQDGRALWLGRMPSRIAVGAALLCITLFILHEQRRIHDLDAARVEASATLNHSRDDQHSLSRQLSASSVPKRVTSRNVVTATAAPLRPHPESVYRNAAVNRLPFRPRIASRRIHRLPDAARRPFGLRSQMGAAITGSHSRRQHSSSK
jgi:hypothetical protein